MSADASSGNLFKVVIRGNLVVAIERAFADDAVEVSSSNLDAGIRLSENHQTNQCIDGDYYFNDINKAKDFAVLSLDFLEKLAVKSAEDLKGHNFFALPTWLNPSVPENEQ